MANDDFAKWATSFSGCDGGNPHQSIWLCGIEYGGGGDRASDLNFSEPLTIPRSEDRPEPEFTKYPYNRNALKLLSALAGRPLEAYRSFYTSQHCFNADSQYFKLNLYPIGFRTTSDEHWSKEFADKTGCETKAHYKQWCHRNRFPWFQTQVQRHNPPLIIGTGVLARDEFFTAFCAHTVFPKKKTIADRTLWWSFTNHGQTLVAVTPFLLNPTGLNSHQRLRTVGNALHELATTNPAYARNFPDHFRRPSAS